MGFRVATVYRQLWIYIGYYVFCFVSFHNSDGDSRVENFFSYSCRSERCGWGFAPCFCNRPAVFKRFDAQNFVSISVTSFDIKCT
jgi:hypothetical protein